MRKRERFVYAAMGAFFWLLFMSAWAGAQVSPQPAEDYGDQIAEIVKAFGSRSYVLGVGLAVMLVVGLVKQGWLGAWVQARVPARYLPLLALGMSVLGVVAADIVAGKDWRQAVFDSIAAGATAVFGHQVIVEGARGGKELIPDRFPAASNVVPIAPRAGPVVVVDPATKPLEPGPSKPAA